MTHSAGCLCGAVRMTLASDPLLGRQCWCSECQKLCAGGPSNNAAFRTEGMTIDGEIRWYGSIAESGRLIERGFCPTCGTPLLARAQGRTDLVMVRIGALDDRELIAPQSMIWVSSAPGWACLNSALPAVERQPPPIA